jgi:hypothetical protein
VVKAVVVGSTQVSAQAAVVASDDDAAAARLLLGVDTVLYSQAGGLDGVVQNGGVLVVSHAAEVDDAVRAQDILGTTGGVLGGAAGDELGVVVGEQVLVEGNLALFGEDGIVGLEVVLVEEGLVAVGLDVYRSQQDRLEEIRNALGAGRTEERILQAEKGVFLCRGHNVRGLVNQLRCVLEQLRLDGDVWRDILYGY